MRRRQTRIWALLSLLPVLVAALKPSASTAGDSGDSKPPAPLQIAQTVALPGLRGSFNHLAADAKRGRFYVTAPSEKKVAVVDLKANKVARVLNDVPASAAKFVADLDVLCLSGGGRVQFLNGDSLAPLGQVELHSPVDELQYSAKEERLYAGVMDSAEPGIVVIDVPKRQLIETISLPAKPQGLVLEQSGSRIYANTPGARQVTVVDRAKRSVVGRWNLTEAQSNCPIALDETNRRLFVGCRRPSCLLVLDTASGSQVAKIETAGDADDMSFDLINKRVYLACGEGAISTIAEIDRDHYRKLPDTPTVEDARNSLFVPELKLFYLAVPAPKGMTAELRAYRAHVER